MAVLCHEREPWCMKTNQYRGDSEPFSVAYSENDTVDRTDRGLELDHAEHNRIFKVGNSPGGVVASAIPSRGPFPLRTLMVCLTIWLIATQAMIFDQLKFDERVHLLEQEARSLGGFRMVLPNEPRNPPTDANVQTL
jgi:hypothetical protein